MSEAQRDQDLRDWISRHLDPLEDREPCDGAQLDLIGGVPYDGEAAPAAVLIGLIRRLEGYSVLLTRRADTLKKHTGQIALPGGRRDPGEAPWETALREAEEEIGLDRRFVTLAGLSTPMLTRTGYLIIPVVGFIAEGFRLSPNPHEVAEIFETPFGFLMDPSNHEQHAYEMEDGAVRHFYAMTHGERYILGVTAGILRELYQRPYGAAVA